MALIPSPEHEPEQFKRLQREQWSLSAEPWSAWWRVFENGAQVVNEEIVRLARIQPGQCVLDVACGLGEPALSVARAFTDTGRVVAFDFSDHMVRLARKRTLDSQLRCIEFLVGDAERMPFADGAFDAATCRWGFMLMPDPTRALREVHRVLKPGARLATSVWCSIDEVPFIGVAHTVAHAELGVPWPDENTPGPLRLGRAGALLEHLTRAGFASVELCKLEVVMTHESVAECVRFQLEMNGVLKRALAEHAVEVQSRVWKVFEAALTPFTATDGAVKFHNQVWVAVAS